MAKQTSKRQLVNDITSAHRRLEKLLATMTRDSLESPGDTGVGSVKDILAHLTAWETLFLDWYQAGVEGSAPVSAPVGRSRKAIDTLNQSIFKQNRNRRLNHVLSDFRKSYERVLATVEAIPEEDIFRRGRYEWTQPFLLADYICGNTCNHYAWATTQIRMIMRKIPARRRLDRTLRLPLRAGKPHR